MRAERDTADRSARGDEVAVQRAIVHPVQRGSMRQLGLAVLLAPFALITVAFMRPSKDS